MKDYYSILYLQNDCTDEQIRKQYRKLAMRYHPDRNADDPLAEDKFKEIAEAYGVLTDPEKRRKYDSTHYNGRTRTYNSTGNWNNTNGRAQAGAQAGGFAYSQEDIFKDLFRDPTFLQLFSGLLKDFQRAGFSSNQQFVDKSFFHGKKGVLLSGAALVGSLVMPAIKKTAHKSLTRNKEKVSSFGKSVLGGLRNSFSGLRNSPVSNRRLRGKLPHSSELDIVYYTPLTRSELRKGKTIKVQVFNEKSREGSETFKVRIPAGSESGQKLRIKGKGHIGGLGQRARGDLYLHLEEEQ